MNHTLSIVAQQLRREDHVARIVRHCHLSVTSNMQTLKQIRCGTLDLEVSRNLQVLQTQNTYHSSYQMVDVVAT